MQNDCAVFRTGEVLDEGVQLMRRPAKKRPHVSIADRSLIWNSDLVEAIELRESDVPGGRHDELGEPTGRKAAARHAREDYPDRDDENWMKHTVTSIDESGRTTFEYRPVHLYTLTNEVQPFPPKARVY